MGRTNYKLGLEGIMYSQFAAKFSIYLGRRRIYG
jgi:hypothetical protein